MPLISSLSSRYERVVLDVGKNRTPDQSYTEHMAALYSFLVTGECKKPEVSHAYSIYADEVQKEIVESLLLVDTDVQTINSVFGLDVSVLLVYKELFFDTEYAFKNKLEKVSYVENYKSKLGKELKLRAVNLGPEFIFYTYGGLIPSPSAQRDLMQKMFMTSAYKAMAMHFNSVTASASKQAAEFAKLMMKAFETLEKYAPQKSNSQDELHQYLLLEINEAVESAGIPVDDEEII